MTKIISTTKKAYTKMTVAGIGLFMLTACNGIFDGIYDLPEEEKAEVNYEKDDKDSIATISGTLYIDASSWENWYYVDFDRMAKLAAEGNDTALQKAYTEFQPYPIPMDATGETTTTAPLSHTTGQYMYWFDCFGAGVSHSEFREFTPTAAQPEPDEWTFAVHRNNARTNGGAVVKTKYKDIAELPQSNAAFSDSIFKEDEWSENEVWDNSEKMLMCLVPSQGIRINKELSSWLKLEIPPMPPAFTLDRSVYILRLKNGRYAALQLDNYMSPAGVKCWLTIKFKYPY